MPSYDVVFIIFDVSEILYTIMLIISIHMAFLQIV